VASVTDGVRRYLQFLVVERGLADNTVESCERDLRRYADFFAARGKRELTDVTQTDVDDLDHLARDPAVLLTGKGGKQRYVPVGSYAVKALDAYLVRGRPALAGKAQRKQSPAVFLNARGGRLTRQGAWGYFAKQRDVLETRTSHPIPSGIPSSPTSSTAARTSASYRSCPDTPR